MGNLRVVLAAVLALTSAVFGLVAPVAAAHDLLPDLKMAVPYNIGIQRGESERVRLRFGTIVWNVGDGPLEVRAGEREHRVMHGVAQWISTSDDDGYAVEPPGAVAFYSGDGHNHWHIQTFIVISLFPKTDIATTPGVSPTYSQRSLRKIGFCLTDLVRAPADLRPPNAATHIRYPVSGCGTLGSESVRMGISPGYGDDYKPFFNNQLVDVTGLAAGTYRLCATVNSTGLWREKDSNAANNSSWVDLELDAAAVRVRVVGSGDTDCERPAPVWYGVGG